MVRRSSPEGGRRNRRPVTGGIALACVVVVGLAIFLVVGADYDSERADIGAAVSVLMFNTVLLVQDEAADTSIVLFFVACALIALASAFCAVTRREWTVAWVGSLFGLAFGPFTLVGIYLIGTSDLYFENDSVMRRTRSLIGAPPSRKDPFFGVIAVVLIGLVIGNPCVIILVAITSSIPLSFVLYVVGLLLIFWFVTFTASAVHRGRATRD